MSPDLAKRIADARTLVLRGAGSDFPAHPYLVTPLTNVHFIELPPQEVRLELVRQRLLPPSFAQKNIICIDNNYRIFYDADFLRSLSLRALAEIIIHEIWHLLREHTERTANLLGTNPEDFSTPVREVLLNILNVFQDAEINQHFNYISDSYVMQEGILPEHVGGTFGETFEQMFVRKWPEIKEILENILKQELNAERKDSSEKLDSQQGSFPLSRESSVFSKAGIPTTELDKLSPEQLSRLLTLMSQNLSYRSLDMHRPDLQSWPEIQRLLREHSLEKPLPELFKRAIQQKVAQDLINLSKRFSMRGSGFSPSILRWAAETIAPARIPYPQVFASVVSRYLSLTQHSHRRLSFARPSRRQIPGFLLPGMLGTRYRVAFLLDTSGSVSDEELGMYLQELRSLMRTYGNLCEVTYYCADSTIQNQARVHLADLKPERLRLIGGGGTNLDIAILQIAGEQRPPQILFVLTDGETPWPPKKPPTIEYIVIGLTRPPSQNFPIPEWADRIIELYDFEW